jgi:heme/copper-type cytochrome/quinol oxidase subunit 2
MIDYQVNSMLFVWAMGTVVVAATVTFIAIWFYYRLQNKRRKHDSNNPSLPKV